MNEACGLGLHDCSIVTCLGLSDLNLRPNMVIVKILKVFLCNLLAIFFNEKTWSVISQDFCSTHTWKYQLSTFDSHSTLIEYSAAGHTKFGFWTLYSATSERCTARHKAVEPLNVQQIDIQHFLFECWMLCSSTYEIRHATPSRRPPPPHPPHPHPLRLMQKCTQRVWTQSCYFAHKEYELSRVICIGKAGLTLLSVRSVIFLL